VTTRPIIPPQQIDAPLTRYSIFLVLTVADDGGSVAAVRSALAGTEDLVKDVSFRAAGAQLSCTVGIGSRVWTRLTGLVQPAELHPFREIAGATHTAVATPGDLLFHIRADRHDVCFELERLLVETLGTATTTVDEVSGFRYFDRRDLLGFVDGTANPIGPDLPDSTVVGDEDPTFAGGSYVLVQKYTHRLAAWQALTTEQQEAIMGRRKADNVELDDVESGQKAHKTLTTITDDDGEHDILRDNMPFGSPGSGEFGTYFIGYSRHLWVIEKMLERMFVGDPPGLHDRLLDFSVAQTGTCYFVPPAAMLAGLDDVGPAPTSSDEAPGPGPALAVPPQDAARGTLGIGSLKIPHPTSTTAGRTPR